MSEENVELVLSLYESVQLVEVAQRNRGRGSGVAVDFHYFQIYRLRDGKVTACWSAPTRDDALHAAGMN